MGIHFSRENSASEGTNSEDQATYHGNVHVITSKQEWQAKLSEAKTNGKIVVVDFSAAWCGPCIMIAPFYAELSEKYTKLLFLKVDVDEMADISAEWDIQAMPSFVFIKDGKQIDKQVGANKAELEKKVKNYATTA
ncbi:thioredoxin H4-1 isoform X2 [Cryptomeria japonica]|uniref:thioredoxin H4-1 isoform X2 n=1 Tax=Cryptomeria japonica TaxID=3369 RepID=UPI0025AC6640|nr:thioredoxin H4-1 isoform X2 [Cryptomeria japonica]XP_057849294.1 thioredoxin H4-1 isoform X2 [Cryptomeria japonica]XP_057849295.1 thioredoxin H4-1 isoform X2 [Cryptomeria japonica]